MTENVKDDLRARVERLGQANRLWRFTAFASFAVILGLLVTVLLQSSQPSVQAQPNAQPKVQPNIGPQFPVDAAQLSTSYTNFCRVNVIPEELVLDFGFNTQMTPNA